MVRTGRKTRTIGRRKTIETTIIDNDFWELVNTEQRILEAMDSYSYKDKEIKTKFKYEIGKNSIVLKVRVVVQ